MSLLIFSALMTVFALSTLSFVASQYIKDASFADVVWGLYFFNIAVDLVLQTGHRTPVQYLDAALVSIWGLRLFWHIARRKVGKPEDWRYAKWRRQWGKEFARRSLLQNFWLQGALALVISSSTIVAAHSTASNGNLHWWQFAGAAVWLVGFLFESVSDWQLGQFLKKRGKGNEIMQSGLWRYSRHPNYFGEVTQWWGLWLLVIALPYGLIAVISPLVITGLIVFISGVPLLESKYRANKLYQAYAKRTSVLIPLPPKSKA